MVRRGRGQPLAVGRVPSVREGPSVALQKGVDPDAEKEGWLCLIPREMCFGTEVTEVSVLWLPQWIPKCLSYRRAF